MTVRCKHWRAGRCDAGHYKGRPSVGVCLRLCPHYDGPSRGLGDTIAKVTKAVGIHKCGGCTQRQMDWNETVPYRRST